MGKPTICIGENKGADQLRGNREADQRLCFRYSDNTVPPLLNFKRGGGSHMRPRTNFVLALHGECIYSNTYKNVFICFEKHF